MIGFIYKIALNNKLYIGKTYTPLKKRIKQHKYDAFTRKTQTPIYHAIRKYGWQTTLSSFEIVEQLECDNKEELNEMLCVKENYYIDLFNTFVPNGYNVHYSNHKKPPILQNKEEVYKKVSKALKGKYLNCEYSSKKIICEQTGIIYPSISEFARYINVSVSSIKNLRYNVWTLAVVDKNFDISKFTKKPMYDVKEKKQKLNKKIICLETNRVYRNSREASLDLSGDAEKVRPNILSSCKYGWKVKGKSYRHYINGNIVPSVEYSKRKTKQRCID